MNQWDFSGNVRLRYEDKQGFAVPGAAGSLDFRDHGADVNNTYLLTRYAQLEAGYGHFFVGDYIKQSLSNAAFGSKDANYLYLQTTINF